MKNTVLPIPEQAKEALARLSSAGYEAFLVGGCVRDFLRGVAPHDFDITTSAYPDEVHAVFADERPVIGVAWRSDDMEANYFFWEYILWECCFPRP